MDSSKIHSYILSAGWALPRTGQNCCERVVWEAENFSWHLTQTFQIYRDPHIHQVILNGIITTHNDLYMTYTAPVCALSIFSLKLRNCQRIYNFSAPPTLITTLVISIKMFTDPITVLSSCGNNRCWCSCLQEWFAFIITRWKMNIKASVISGGWDYIVTFPMLCNYFTNLCIPV